MFYKKQIMLQFVKLCFNLPGEWRFLPADTGSAIGFILLHNCLYLIGLFFYRIITGNLLICYKKARF